MIWGKTNVQRQFVAATAIAIKKKLSGKWLKHFAWFPVWLDDGRMLWLEWCDRMISYSWSNSGYEYTVIKYKTIIYDN